MMCSLRAVLLVPLFLRNVAHASTECVDKSPEVLETQLEVSWPSSMLGFARDRYHSTNHVYNRLVSGTMDGRRYAL